MRTTLIPKTRLALLPLAAVLLLTMACGDEPTEPTDPIIEQTIEIDTRPLDPGGTTTVLVSLSQTSTLQVMLAGAVLDNPPRSISPTLTLRLSRLSGTDCQPFLEIQAQPRLTAAIHQFLDPSSYCISVIDQGALTQSANVTLRVVSPALTNVDGTPGTDTFASTLMPSGVASRTFRATTGGLVNITLTSLSGEPADVVLGLGLFDNEIGVCRTVHVVTTRPGPSPQISTQIDAGEYCAMLSDVGSITGPQMFSMTIQHP